MGEQGVRKTNWSAIAVAITIIGWLLAAAGGAFGDYRRIDQRLTVLETQRQHDAQRMERIENKLDRVLERLKP